MSYSGEQSYVDRRRVIYAVIDTMERSASKSMAMGEVNVLCGTTASLEAAKREGNNIKAP